MKGLELGLTQVVESNADLEDILPTYGSDKAAAFDLRADLEGRDIKVMWDGGSYTVKGSSGKLILEPNARVLIPTGFVFGIPEGYQMNIYSRSGLTWKNGIIVLNAPALIDFDYKDETFVVLYNSSSNPFVIEHGMRVAQAAINPVHRVELGSLGERKGGFGSSGK